ncbi:MAG: hypothetical protein MUO42_10610 [Anaerolineaceae bacterium]|nr:hypothetical protein [Anaerolineaceae bacterium]
MEKPEITLDIDAVLKGQGADPVIIADRKPGLLKIAQAALDMGLPLLQQKSFRKSLSVDSLQHDEIILEGGLRINMGGFAKLLCSANAVEMVICTIGDQLEKQSAELFRIDAALALALDGLANAAIDRLTESICCELESEAQAEGLKTSMPISPGSRDWPLEIGQPIFFETIKPDPSVIRLSDSFLMIPRKSSSFIVGIGKDFKKSGKTCDLCSVQETCRYKIRKNF